MLELRQARDKINQHIDILIELREDLSQLNMEGSKG